MYYIILFIYYGLGSIYFLYYSISKHMSNKKNKITNSIIMFDNSLMENLIV